MYLVSSCLIGENCRYDGGNCYSKRILEYLDGKSYFSICPEVVAGFSVPRKPIEWRENRCISKDGTDFTKELKEGCLKAFEIALREAEVRNEKIEGAILKEKSPTCGCRQIYDGSFQGVLIEKSGEFARIIKKNNIEIKSEIDI